MSRCLYRCLMLLLLSAASAASLAANEPKTLDGHNSPVLAIVFSPDGKTLAAAAASVKFSETTGKQEVEHPEVKLWNVAAGREQMSLQGTSGVVFSLAFSSDGRTLVTAGGDVTAFKIVTRDDGQTGIEFPGEVALWDPATGKSKRRLEGHTSIVMAAVFAPGDRVLATAAGESVTLWDPATGKQLATLEAEDRGTVSSLAFSPDGRTLAIPGYRLDAEAGAVFGTVNLWDVAARTKTATLQGSGAPPLYLAFSPDGRTLATSGYESPARVMLLDVRRGKERAVLTGHRDFIQSIEFSSDGSLLATGSIDGTLKLWNVNTGEERASLLEGEAGYVHCVAFSPDGRTLAAGSYDRKVRLWDLEKVLGQ